MCCMFRKKTYLKNMGSQMTYDDITFWSRNTTFLGWKSHLLLHTHHIVATTLSTSHSGGKDSQRRLRSGAYIHTWLWWLTQTRTYMETHHIREACNIAIGTSYDWGTRLWQPCCDNICYGLLLHLTTYIADRLLHGLQTTQQRQQGTTSYYCHWNGRSLRSTHIRYHTSTQVWED